MKTMRDVLLGYLTWVQSPSKSMSVAGFLVTNHRGIPIEFRYTDPVQTNSTQELLYGEQNIDEAISVTMAASLWKSLEQKPRVLLVEDTAAGRLWEHLATKEKTLVVCMEVPPAGVYLPTHHGGALVPLDMDATRSARIQVFPDAAAALEHAEDLLTHIAQKMRLDEPFERVEAILKRLHELPENERRYRSASFEAAETPKTSSRQAPSRLEQPRRTSRPNLLEEDLPPRAAPNNNDDDTNKTFKKATVSSDADVEAMGAESRARMAEHVRNRDGLGESPVRPRLYGEDAEPRRAFKSVERSRAAIKGSSAKVSANTTNLSEVELVEPVRVDEDEWWVNSRSKMRAPEAPQSPRQDKLRPASRLRDEDGSEVVGAPDLRTRPDLGWMYRKNQD